MLYKSKICTYIDRKFTYSHLTIHFFFSSSEILYEMADHSSKPEILSTMKIKISYQLSHSYVNGKLCLKYIVSFAEDYTNGILIPKQGLILLYLIHSKILILVSLVHHQKLLKSEYQTYYLEDRHKLFNRSGRGSNIILRVKILFRMQEIDELRTLRIKSSDIWLVKTKNIFMRRRYIIIDIQSKDKNENKTKIDIQCSHVGQQ